MVLHATIPTPYSLLTLPSHTILLRRSLARHEANICDTTVPILRPLAGEIGFYKGFSTLAIFRYHLTEKRGSMCSSTPSIYDFTCVTLVNTDTALFLHSRRAPPEPQEGIFGVDLRHRSQNLLEPRLYSICNARSHSHGPLTFQVGWCSWLPSRGAIV